MQVRIGLENQIEGRSLAWVLDFPGCFAYGKDGTEAILRTPQALLTFREWVGEKTVNSWLEDLEDFDIALTEIFECYTIKNEKDDYEVNAWFNDDVRALSSVEVERGLAMLDWSRADLESLLATLSRDQLDQKFTDERWSIEGVVRHVANANWWYLDRLGLAGIDLSKASSNSVERMSQVQDELQRVLPTLVNTSLMKIVGGETWSPRKVLRRAIWHMRDHYFHIERLLTLLH
jgi:hypothetical protein